MRLFQKNRKPNGQVLVTTLVVLGLVGVGAVAFLNLMTSNANFNARSQAWNNCIPVAEAGVEEAFAFLNETTSTNLAPKNGWAWNTASNAFYKQRFLGTNYYEVCISTNNGALKPTITSIGYVTAPVTVGSGLALMATTGVPPPPRYIRRAVQVTTVKQPALPKGMVMKNKINFNGNNVVIDSYDAEVGPYNLVTNCKDGGDVCTDADIDGGVSLGNANIKGHLWVGPNAALKIGPGSSIGSVGWVSGGAKGIQTGWLRKDSNLTLRDVTTPWAGSMPAPSTSGSYKYTLAGGNYEITGDCIMNSADLMLVQGTSTLWVKGNFNMAGTAIMTDPGTSLTVYVNGSINFSGTWNKSMDPKDLIIYGLPTCKAITLVTGSKIECALYAPSAAITLVGSAALYGSMTGYSVSMNGNTGFHYDESLGRRTGTMGYRPVSWREL